MRSIFGHQNLKMCFKVAFGAMKYTDKISAIYNKKCRSFIMTPKIKFIFWAKFKMLISAVPHKATVPKGVLLQKFGLGTPTYMGCDLNNLKNNSS